VAIDYFLKAGADPVTIEILDAHGASVRTFTGTAASATPPPTAPSAGTAGEGENPRAAAASVPVKEGMNRFTWDMRYPGARDFPGLIMWAGSTRGPQAPPGRYIVKLTANGMTRSQDFTISRNRAVKDVTDADLQAQFELAREINAKVNAANEAVLRIRSVRDQITARLANTRDGQIARAGKTLIEKLTGVEGELYQYRNRSSQDPLNFPIRLNNKLAALQGLVEYGDHKPTDQARAVFMELSDRLEIQLAQLDAMGKKELALLNTLLVKKKLEPIKDGTPPVSADP
jgi:hypothetical protein